MRLNRARMKKGSTKKKAPIAEEPQEWDLEAGFGILPEDISLTQNLGCASSRPKKQKDKNSDNQTNK